MIFIDFQQKKPGKTITHCRFLPACMPGAVPVVAAPHSIKLKVQTCNVYLKREVIYFLEIKLHERTQTQFWRIGVIQVSKTTNQVEP